ncbi:MAG: alanine-tRNA synthetase second additional domain-containing protein [Firmicutes bacterium]|nr:alanine-tRNA synthetase second additional domain-containing protein [Bacillota bacterium]
MSVNDKTMSNHIYSTYYAPRGRQRIFDLGIQLSQQYLSPFDKLIGVIGEPGSGKSALIKGMFPGLELTNDDDGVNVRPLPILEQDNETGFFTPHTYHMDIRFEMGFTQLATLADAILKAIQRGKRVIVEHFDLIYEMLGINADLLIGVGEEIILTRPNIFGPEPQELYDIVQKSSPYRLMAHTAEDLCEFCMDREIMMSCQHDDIHHGFVLVFSGEEPNINIPELEKNVQSLIDKEIPITYLDEDHIAIDGIPHQCTGPRTHVSNTRQILGFKLLPHFVHDTLNNRFLLVGCVGEDSEKRLAQLEAAIAHGFNSLNLY